MATLFHVTVRNAQDEVMEFESTQPVLHIDVPAGRYLITVRCAQGEQPVAIPDRRGAVH
jgi:hypothetical protein